MPSTSTVQRRPDESAAASPNPADILQGVGMGLLTCALASGAGAALTHGKPEAGVIALAGAALTAIPTIQALRRIDGSRNSGDGEA